MKRFERTTLMSSFRLLAAGLMASAVLTVASPAQAQMCGTAQSTPLIAGQHYRAGQVVNYNDATFLYVTYVLDAPWTMSVGHVAAAGTLDGIAQTRSGNPVPGHFQFHATFDRPVTTHAVVIPRATLPSTGQVVVAAHADVHAPQSAGGSQGAWGAGPGFPGANWATYIAYPLQPCGAYVE
jgi:hypothetical protein